MFDAARQRALSLVFLFTISTLATIVICGCGVPVAPAYQIQKESLTVHFIPGNAPHLAIRAEYRLANIGNSPLQSIDVGVPEAIAPTITDLQISVNGTNLSSSPLLTSRATPKGESHFVKIPFNSEWTQKEKKQISIQYNIEKLNKESGTLSQRGFFLAESEWLPNLRPPKAFLASAKMPTALQVNVIVPPDFLAVSSGTAHGRHKVAGGIEHRFTLRAANDRPFVLSGAYKQQEISTPAGSVIFWSFYGLPVDRLQSAAASIAHASEFLESTFKLRKTGAFRIAVVPNSDWRTGSELDNFPNGLLTTGYHLQQLESSTDRSAALEIIDSSLGYQLLNESISPREDAWLLHGALLVWIGRVVDENQGFGSSRATAIANTLQDYERQEETAVPKPPLDVALTDGQPQLQMALYQAELFLAALEDKCGQQNVTHAIAHMVYALRGGEYGYPEFRSALEEQCHQDLADFFRTWLAQPGIPPDFRARYENAGVNVIKP